MDSLAAAVKAGYVDPETCLNQLFAPPSDMRDMRAVLRDEGRDLWPNDRHRGALLKLGAASIDLGSYADVASVFDSAYHRPVRRQISRPKEWCNLDRTRPCARLDCFGEEPRQIFGCRNCGDGKSGSCQQKRRLLTIMSAVRSPPFIVTQRVGRRGVVVVGRRCGLQALGTARGF